MEIRELQYATAKDVMDAAELVFDNISTNVVKDSVFDINSAISITSFGCIKETDRVLVSASNVNEIAWVISYVYVPERMDVNRIIKSGDEHIMETYDENLWREVGELLGGYNYTKANPSYLKIDEIEYEEECFDVAVMGYVNPFERTGLKADGRFVLETGIEYECFEKLLKIAGRLLKQDGRLIILSKPGWVLKAWALIEELGLQMEYLDYSYYTQEENHPNVFVWLRFSKRQEAFDIEKQKKNMQDFMKDNYVDRLYAHRNDLIFPYVELSYTNTEAYVQMDQNLQYMQYFFTIETTENLAKLCEGYTACLTTPSVAQCACKTNKNIILFERDNRFRQVDGLKFVKYDLNTGLTRFTYNKYAKKFDRVICDPPFDINLEDLARDIDELLKNGDDSIAYVVFPEKRRASLINSMRSRGLILSEDDGTISIEYGKPPKLVRVNGKDAIQLYRFVYENKCS